jgi:hypothetical protein
MGSAGLSPSGSWAIYCGSWGWAGCCGCHAHGVSAAVVSDVGAAIYGVTIIFAYICVSKSPLEESQGFPPQNKQ